jgi:hypothetical protein
VALEVPAHGLDPLDDAALVAPGAEGLLHVRADRLPVGGAAGTGDAAIGDDLDIAIGEQQIDEDAVVLLGVPDPEGGEDLESTRVRGQF